LANIAAKLLPLKIETRVSHGVDLSKYTTEELKVFQRLMLKAQVPLLDEGTGPVIEGEVIDRALSPDSKEYLLRKEILARAAEEPTIPPTEEEESTQ
jgi:hypothetical protein